MGSLTYSNTSDFGWVVQKFGGTSVGKFPDKVCRPSPASASPSQKPNQHVEKRHSC